MAKRGRPTPEDVLERDGKVLTLLADQQPRTRNEIADALGIKNRRLVYLALSRLRDADEVRKADRPGKRNHWTIT